jgi:adenylate kinase family enzyme
MKCLVIEFNLLAVKTIAYALKKKEEGGGAERRVMSGKVVEFDGRFFVLPRWDVSQNIQETVLKLLRQSVEAQVSAELASVFLIDGYPREVDQVEAFEQQVSHKV